MTGGWRRFLVAVLAALMMLALVGVVGCTGGDDDTEATETSDDMDSAAEDAGEPADDGGGADEAALREGAKDIAQAWLVGPGSDMTADELTFTTETLLQDDEGGWWARVSAVPDDMSMETEQLYMHLPPGMTLWTHFDSGTGIDPADDDRFPAEIRDGL